MGTIIPFRRPEPQSFRELLEQRVPAHVNRLLSQGGPQEADYHAAAAFTGILGQRGDEMQFIGFEPKKQQEVARSQDEFARHVAALAFLPNGIRLFGLHIQVIDGVLTMKPAEGVAGEFLHLSGRKTTGSYYTPRELIECLLDSALDPVLDEAIGRKRPHS